jgi:hypothetical protein
MSWLVQVVRLPLPTIPLSEMVPAGTAIVPDKHFPDEQAALAFARELVQRGYRVRIVGDGVTIESDEVLRRLNTEHMSVMISIGKSQIVGGMIFGVAALVPVEALASAYHHLDVDAHNARIALQFNAVTPASGTGTISLSFGSGAVTSISAVQHGTFFFLDGVVVDATMEAERRLTLYQAPLVQHPRPADAMSGAGHRITTVHFTFEPPVPLPEKT